MLVGAALLQLYLARLEPGACGEGFWTLELVRGAYSLFKEPVIPSKRFCPAYSQCPWDTRVSASLLHASR